MPAALPRPVRACSDTRSRPRPIRMGPGTRSSAACGRPSGGNGWADVWMTGHFGWEYKGKHRDLAPPTTNCYCTATIWRTRRCWSSATWTGSRSTRTLPARSRSPRLRPRRLGPAREPGHPAQGLHRPGRAEARADARRRHGQAAELFGQLADGLRVREHPGTGRRPTS